MNNNSDIVNSILKSEGGFVNHKDDKGGRTYRGITQKWFPNWQGWEDLEEDKPRNYTNQKLDNLAFNFYDNLLRSYKLHLINDVNVRHVIFDYIVGSGAAIKRIQRILKVSPDGIIGAQTLKAINNYNSKELVQKIVNDRAEYYYYLVSKDPTQRVFLKGWLNRLKKFNVQIELKKDNIVAYIPIFLVGYLVLR